MKIKILSQIETAHCKHIQSRVLIHDSGLNGLLNMEIYVKFTWIFRPNNRLLYKQILNSLYKHDFYNRMS